MTPKWLTTKSTLALAGIAVGAFHWGYVQESFAAPIFVYLACLYALAWVRSSRWAFYTGLAIGLAIAAGQLWFFTGIFGPAAVGLWCVLGFWTGLYLVSAHATVARWPRGGPFHLPVLWLAFEYFRSELYYLRFAWLTPGMGLAHPDWVWLVGVGVYGFSLLTLLAYAAGHALAKRPATGLAGLIVILSAFVAATSHSSVDSSPRGPVVAGIQLEGVADAQVLEALDGVLERRPDLVVLSEYTFDGPVPESVRDWCRLHQKYLIAGGKKRVDGGSDYYNTAYVIGPDGETAFEQAKAVPVQFMTDGLPASGQAVWESPWGKIGLAICYDLSYARVIDPLVAAGAQALVIPTMDNLEWGDQERWLHSKVAPIRAREYRIPIFRLASSGISQIVDARGTVVASAPSPGQGEIISATLPMHHAGTLPIDRFLAMPCVALSGGLLLYLRFAPRREMTI